MARVFITGSSDGLGLMAAKLLIDEGHEVVLHGQNEARRRDAFAAAPCRVRDPRSLLRQPRLAQAVDHPVPIFEQARIALGFVV